MHEDRHGCGEARWSIILTKDVCYKRTNLSVDGILGIDTIESLTQLNQHPYRTSAGMMLEEQAKDVISTFFASLAVYLSGVETHKVNGTCMGHPKFLVQCCA